MSKNQRIKELEEEVDYLKTVNRDLFRDYMNQANRTSEVPAKKKQYAGDVAFDFWPLSDWLRLTIKKWNPGRYLQVCVGPVRVEFFEV